MAYMLDAMNASYEDGLSAWVQVLCQDCMLGRILGVALWFVAD